MTVAATTPFAGLLELFVVVPLCIAFGICGADCASADKRRPKRPNRP